MNLGACPQLNTHPQFGHWYRAVPLHQYQTLLSYAHNFVSVSRFNACDSRNLYPIFYFADNQQTALFEARAIIGSSISGGSFFPNPQSSWAVITVQVRLQHIADLTIPSQRRLIKTTVQELTGDWVGYRLRKQKVPANHPYTDVPTQRLGAALEAIPQVEGFLTYSARDARRKNLVVFPHKLTTGSWLKFLNPITGKTDRITP